MRNDSGAGVLRADASALHGTGSEEVPREFARTPDEGISINRFARIVAGWPPKLPTASTIAERLLYLPEIEAVRELIKDHNLTKAGEQILAMRLVPSYRLAAILNEVALGMLGESARADGIKIDILQRFLPLVHRADKTTVEIYKALFRGPPTLVNYQALRVEVSNGPRV